MVFENLIKYILEGLAVALAAFFIPNNKIGVKEIILIALTSSAIFSLLDATSPTIGEATRQGAGFGIGLNQVGWGPNMHIGGQMRCQCQINRAELGKFCNVESNNNTSSNNTSSNNTSSSNTSSTNAVKKFTDAYVDYMMVFSPVRAMQDLAQQRSKMEMLEAPYNELITMGENLPPTTEIKLSSDQLSKLLKATGLKAPPVIKPQSVMDIIKFLRYSRNAYYRDKDKTLQP